MSFYIQRIIFYWNYSPVWLVLLITAIPIAIWIFLLIRLKPKKMKICSAVLTVLSVTAIVYIAVLSRDQSTTYAMNLIPFSFIERGLENYVILREYWMNVYLFIPLGLGLSGLLKNKSWLPVTMGFCFSMMIEAVQYFFGLGLCEVDDVIANTIGCLIGVIIYKLALNLKKIRKEG